MSRVDTVNRVLLAIAGALLAACGIGVLLLGLGVFGSRRSRLPVVDDYTTRVFDDGRPWLWPVLAGVGALLVALLLWWLVAQVRTRRLARLEVDRTTLGGIRMVTSALGDAVNAEAEQVEGVTRARARMVSRRHGHELELVVWLAPPYDVPAALQELEQTVLTHARYAVGDPDLPIRVHLEADAGERSRVH